MLNVEKFAEKREFNKIVAEQKAIQNQSESPRMKK